MSKNNSDFFKVKNSWSKIKDKLLGCYLAPYFQKVLMTRKPITYVDCFAGKGKFDDGNDGSPLIALQCRDACLAKSAVDQKYNAIETWFIELIAIFEIIDSKKRQQTSVGNPEWKSGSELLLKHPEAHQEIESSSRAESLLLWTTFFQ